MNWSRKLKIYKFVPELFFPETMSEKDREIFIFIESWLYDLKEIKLETPNNFHYMNNNTFALAIDKKHGIIRVRYYGFVQVLIETYKLSSEDISLILTDKIKNKINLEMCNGLSFEYRAPF